MTLATNLVDEYSRRWTDRTVSVTKAPGLAEVLVDAELIELALRQLLDNACKYSQPRSSIAANIQSGDGFVRMRIWNNESSFFPGERDRIFDRFYRGAQTRQRTPGSGLGLYVARKIVYAHGGNLDLEAQPLSSDGVAFRLTLPIPRNEF